MSTRNEDARRVRTGVRTGLLNERDYIPSKALDKFLTDYVKAGLFLVPIPPVHGRPVKGPTRQGWNRPRDPDNPHGYSNDPADILRRTKAPGSNIGLALGPSKVSSIDLDDLRMSREVLALADIDIDALMADPESVQIIGRTGRGKLLYRVPEGFECSTVTLTYGEKGKGERMIFELRYKGSNGHTAQDLLPPSWHPDTNMPYQLVGDITKIPPLPQAIADLWTHWDEWKPVLQSLDPHQAEAINKAKKPKPKARAAQVEGTTDPIASFNEQHSIHEVLTSHEYKRKGKRYIRPGSTSGVPGIVLLDDEHIYSHGGDVLADGHKHDAFDVYRLLGCGGDWKTALDWDPEITRRNREVWREAKENGSKDPPHWEDPPIEAYADDPYAWEQGKEKTEEGTEGRESEHIEEPIPPKQPGARPEIMVRDGFLPQSLSQGEAALLSYGVEVFQRGGLLQRPVVLDRAIKEDGIDFPAGQASLVMADEHWFEIAFTEAAQWYRYDRRSIEWRRMDCPPKVARKYVANVGRWRLPVLGGIVEGPTLRRDGTLLAKPGYDRVSRLYLTSNVKVSVPETPTREDAMRAIKILKAPFEEFPFVEDFHRSVALSGVLTAVIRKSLRTAPMHGIDAPIMGSGKGLIADCASLIATGHTCVYIAQGADETEDEKRLDALLMKGCSVLCIDNVEAPLRGQRLCQLFTAESVDARVLGLSKIVTLPTAITVLCTGNNLVFAGDLVRRALVCKIDPKCERPDERDFKRNLHEYVPAHQAEFLGAALTILRSYHLAGRPRRGTYKTYGSFEEWSDWVRGALIWLGEPDPCLSRSDIDKRDPVKTNLKSVLVAWYESFGDSAMTVREAIEACDDKSRLALREALLNVSGKGKEIDAKSLGQWLRRYEGRVESSMSFARAGEDTHGKVVKWCVLAN